MSRSGYITHVPVVEVGGEFDIPPSGPGMGSWETEEPCRYIHKNCKGKLFGALKSCRREREKSQALCQAHQSAEQREKQMQQEALEREKNLLSNLQNEVVASSEHQKVSGSTLKVGLGFAGVGVLALGAVILFRK